MKNLKMGVGCFIGPDVTFGLDAPITLGERVAISTGVVLSTATHMLGPGSRRMTLGTHAKPIVIEDGAWVALRAIILPGVHVGRGSVITAGSVVTSDVPRDTLVSGNPAVVIRSLPLGNR
jgi:acetyltransferase-like isoleucine patch superfamily enzyme